MLTFISGPCVLESEDHTKIALEAILKQIDGLDINFMFKTSIYKDNRTSVSSYSGPGYSKGLEILNRIKNEYNIPITTLIHDKHVAAEAADIVDMIMIPSLLSRETDLILEAAKQNCKIGLKKGQFLSPVEMAFAVEKAHSTGNSDITLIERGNSFGYQNNIVDMRSIIVMKEFGFPVLFDATHSVQSSGGNKTYSGGDRSMSFPLARAAVATGADGIYLETHNNPEVALCDSSIQTNIRDVREMLLCLLDIYRVINRLL